MKNANDRQADARNRIEQYKKENKPAPVPIQEELERSEAAKIKIQAQIAQKRKEIVDLNQQDRRHEEALRRTDRHGAACDPGACARTCCRDHQTGGFTRACRRHQRGRRQKIALARAELLLQQRVHLRGIGFAF